MKNLAQEAINRHNEELIAEQLIKYAESKYPTGTAIKVMRGSNILKDLFYAIVNSCKLTDKVYIGLSVIGMNKNGDIVSALNSNEPISVCEWKVLKVMPSIFLDAYKNSMVANVVLYDSKLDRWAEIDYSEVELQDESED